MPSSSAFPSSVGWRPVARIVNPMSSFGLPNPTPSSTTRVLDSCTTVYKREQPKKKQEEEEKEKKSLEISKQEQNERWFRPHFTRKEAEVFYCLVVL
jgi:hypothetical protein